MKIKNFDDLMEAAGGEANLAAKLGVHQLTIYAWKRRGGGIPHRYWNSIMKIVGCSTDELHKVNNEIYKRFRS